jgi:hypothetical protein
MSFMSIDDAVARALEDRPDPAQVAAFRRLSPQERLRTAHQLYCLARKVKAAGIRSAHPEWCDAEVESAVSRAILRGKATE